MNVDKKQVARAQLGTALALFLDDLDPVSVHTLACAGGEIAERLALKAGKRSFALHALDTFPDLKPGELKALRNQYCNAFKHATTQKGVDRDDAALFQRFSDEMNVHSLFVGWYDYTVAIAELPIEAQVFQIWYFALYPEKLNPDAKTHDFDSMFPNIRAMTRPDRKRELRKVIRSARADDEVMADSRTDRTPLIGHGDCRENPN